MKSLPKLSLILPVYNGGKTLPAFFIALKKQNFYPQEILVCDSSSSDNSKEICKEYGATIISIAKEEFDHGSTRTMLAQKAQGELLLFLTQDAILLDENSIKNIVLSCTKHKHIACAYGRQIPADNATIQAASLRFFNYPDSSQIRRKNDKEKYGLKTAFISNSFAIYKKDILAQQNYFESNLIFGEDTCALGKLLLAGYSVAYCAEAVVIHSHNYTLSEEFRRSFDIGVLHSSQDWLLYSFGGAASVGGDFVRFSLKKILEKRRYILIIDWLVRNGFKYIGYKLGRNYKFIPYFLKPFLSMHSSWWMAQNSKNHNNI